MHDVKVTNVLFAVHNDTHTAHVTATSDHNQIACIEFDDTSDLTLNEVESNGIVHFDGRIGVADGATVVGDNVRNPPVTKGNPLHL